MDYDLIVLGGGAGGMGAARAGARKHKRTLLIQDGEIGGDCTFTGCVPSKAFIAAAAKGRTFAEAMASAHRAIKTIAATEDAEVFRAEGIDVRAGRARFVSQNEVALDGSRIAAERFVIATGARPAVPAIDGLKALDHLTSDDVWTLSDRPDSLVVLGGGAIGCELTQAFSRLGTRVTILEAADRLLSKEEPEASAAIEAVFRREGIDVRTGSPVTKVEETGPGGAARVHVEGGSSVEGDRVLVAIGRAPVTDGLEPEAAGVDLDGRGFIRTDDYLRTTAANIWSVGDVAGKLQFTHAADEMARIAVGNAFNRFRQRRFRSERMPWVTFTSPEVGRVGLTEAEAFESVGGAGAKRVTSVGGAGAKGARILFLPMTEVDRAVAADETDGFVKIVVGPRWVAGNLAGGRVLGATVVCSTGGELIHELALAIRSGMFPARIALTTHAYPTWSMAVQKAMGQLFYEIEGRRAEPARRGGPLRS